MLEKIQEEFYKIIREGLLYQTSVEIQFKYFLIEWFSKQSVEDRVFSRALLDFDKKYNLDHVIILGGKGPMSIRFWWKKGRIMEENNA